MRRAPLVKRQRRQKARLAAMVTSLGCLTGGPKVSAGGLNVTSTSPFAQRAILRPDDQAKQ